MAVGGARRLGAGGFLEFDFGGVGEVVGDGGEEGRRRDGDLKVAATGREARPRNQAF